MTITETKLNDLNNYCQDHSEKNSSILKAIEKYTWENEDVPQMISGQLVGNFLQSIIKMIQAKRILEIGMFTGFSALKMAEVLSDDGEIHTCELMDKHVKTAKKNFDKSNHGNKITIHFGPALESLGQLRSGSFDMAFIDADKINYLEYYQMCLTLINQNGIIDSRKILYLK